MAPDIHSGHRETFEAFVGKDILELLSSAMYIDPMTVYREYIQNAADAVDHKLANSAKENTIPVTCGDDQRRRVDITVDQNSRSVKIRDYGHGVHHREFLHKLTAIGGSEKRGTFARGFRGVGRLAGLGYAQELIFRSRANGEKKVSQLRWDCRLLKASLRDATNRLGIVDLIQRATSHEQIEIDEVPACFFEVEMRGVLRIGNDSLMSPKAIADYLCQVGPVPFSPKFSFRSDVITKLGPYVDLHGLEIHINGSKGPLYRPHRDLITVDDKRKINFNALSFVEIPGIDNKVAAIGWVLHHEYAGMIPKDTLINGLRLRAGNIQIGDQAVLRGIFPEPRFNGWASAEIHIIDQRIVPNGRRDQFEQNVHYRNVTNHLAPTARDIARRCRNSSQQRNIVREFEGHATAITEKLDILGQGSIGRHHQEELALTIEQHLLRMQTLAEKSAFFDPEGKSIKTIEMYRSRLIETMDDKVLVKSPLDRLSANKRRSYEQFFELIYECSSNRVAAKALIDRILLRLV